MTLDITLTAENYIAGRKLGLRPRKSLRVALYAIAVIYGLLFLSEIISVARGDTPLGDILWMLALPGYFWFLYFVLLPWRTRRLFNEHTLLQDPTRWQFEDDGTIHVSTPRGHATLKWGDFHKWKANDKIVLLYQSSLIFNMFPRAAFADDSDYRAFMEMARRHLGAQKS